MPLAILEITLFHNVIINKMLTTITPKFYAVNLHQNHKFTLFIVRPKLMITYVLKGTV